MRRGRPSSRHDSCGRQHAGLMDFISLGVRAPVVCPASGRATESSLNFATNSSGEVCCRSRQPALCGRERNVAGTSRGARRPRRRRTRQPLPRRLLHGRCGRGALHLRRVCGECIWPRRCVRSGARSACWGRIRRLGLRCVGPLAKGRGRTGSIERTGRPWEAAGSVHVSWTQ
jgi:hypothetical protein